MKRKPSSESPPPEQPAQGKRKLLDSPPELEALRERARTQVAPVVNPEEEELIQDLLILLRPSIVRIAPKNEGGIVKEVLREPMLMVVWDRAAGRWRWSITDRTYEISTSGYVASLLDLAEQMSGQIKDGKVIVKDLGISSDDQGRRK